MPEAVAPPPSTSRPMKRHVLIVDDDPSLCAVLGADLARGGFRTTATQEPEVALALVCGTQDDDVDAILADVNTGSLPGTELCARVVASGRGVPVVLMTAFATLELVVAAIRAGAEDFVRKPLDPDALKATLTRATDARALRREIARARRAAEEPGFEGIVGNSRPMRMVFDVIERVSSSDVSVLVTGESGTGKELVARAIHRRSRRAKGPFVALHCPAVPEALLESELFGHVKGAFTDARSARSGLFVKASGGTLFLDEIGDMSPALQAKLLRALQERTVRPVGGDEEVPFDTRVIAATWRDVEADVAARRFREDLYYRLNVVRVAMPPLRERKSDVLLIAQHVLRRCQPHGLRVLGFTEAALASLLERAWPGNVRQLQSCVERAVVLAQFDHVRRVDLGDGAPVRPSLGIPVDVASPGGFVTVEELERRYASFVLRATGGNASAAAHVLGCDRRTLSRKLGAPGDDAAA
jgi:DNA-binding NtrC family response regulator